MIHKLHFLAGNTHHNMLALMFHFFIFKAYSPYWILLSSLMHKIKLFFINPVVKIILPSFEPCPIILI